ncbi:hypothetical protein BHS07_20020 [Myxococcus xanthus]|nr:hypothetical protein BHS07_20020 [Myxococcus xanthus]QDE97789.1 hypothetical protein BHS05_19170 [Myxococcus xanthus]
MDGLGTFSSWLEEELAALTEALEGASLSIKATAPAKAKGPAALFDKFPRDSKALLFNGRKLGELPALRGNRAAAPGAPRVQGGGGLSAGEAPPPVASLPVGRPV